MDSELVRALSQISLIEADSTSSAAEKVQSMAKTARQALAAHDAREGERGGIVTGRRKGPNGEDVFTVRPTFGEPFEVTRYAAQPQPSVADDAQRVGGINIEHDQPCAQATAQDVRDSFVASWAAAGYALKPNGCAAPMSELDDLPERVRAAIRTMSGEAGGNRDDAYDVIEAELLRLSSRVKELERENAELHADNTKAWGIADAEAQSAGRLCRQLGRAESDLAELRTALNHVNDNTLRAKQAESELDALRGRIAGQVALMKEVRGYLTAASEGSMSRNNSEQLASELLDQVNALLDMGEDNAQ